MTGFLERSNLRPQEKRLVVVIAFVFFVVFNVWFVWPHFHDWANLEDDLAKSRHKLGLAREEIARVGGTNGYDAQLKRLESAGDAVPPEDQAIKFAMSVEQIARQSGLPVTAISAAQDSTDIANSKFFVEKSLNLVFENTEEKTLVNFLYNLGVQSALFRVKDLEVKPHVGRYRLSGRVTIIASYLKDPGKAAPAPAKLADKKLSAVPAAGSPAKKPAVPPVKPSVPPPGRIHSNAPGRGPLPVNKPGSPGGRQAPPGNRPRPMVVPTNSRAYKPPVPASHQ